MGDRNEVNFPLIDKFHDFANNNFTITKKAFYSEGFLYFSR